MTVYPPAMPTPKGDDMLLGVVKQHLPGSARARFPFTRPVQQGPSRATRSSADGRFLPAATLPTGTIPDIADPAGGAAYTAATWPTDQEVVAAFGVDGDAYPRITLFADSSQGLLFGDGTHNAYSDSIHFGLILLDGGTDLRFIGNAGQLKFGVSESVVQVDQFDDFGDVLIRSNSTRAEVRVTTEDSQTLPAFHVVSGPSTTFKVLPDGTVKTKAVLTPGVFATADRPTGADVGSMIFDTDLLKPVWSDGLGGWVDATGTPV